MTLLSEVREDVRTSTLQPHTWQADARGDEYGSGWVPEGDPLPCAYMELGSAERYEAGRQESDRMLRVFIDLGPPPDRICPVTERMQVQIPGPGEGEGEGRIYDVASAVSVVSDPDYGAILELVSV